MTQQHNQCWNENATTSQHPRKLIIVQKGEALLKILDEGLYLKLGDTFIISRKKRKHYPYHITKFNAIAVMA